MNNRKLKEKVMNNILDVYGYYDYIRLKLDKVNNKALVENRRKTYIFEKVMAENNQTILMCSEGINCNNPTGLLKIDNITQKIISVNVSNKDKEKGYEEILMDVGKCLFFLNDMHCYKHAA